jgi:hypothetical protein
MLFIYYVIVLPVVPSLYFYYDSPSKCSYINIVFCPVLPVLVTQAVNVRASKDPNMLNICGVMSTAYS